MHTYEVNYVDYDGDFVDREIEATECKLGSTGQLTFWRYGILVAAFAQGVWTSVTLEQSEVLDVEE